MGAVERGKLLSDIGVVDVDDHVTAFLVRATEESGKGVDVRGFQIIGVAVSPPCACFQNFHHVLLCRFLGHFSLAAFVCTVTLYRL